MARSSPSFLHNKASIAKTGPKEKGKNDGILLFIRDRRRPRRETRENRPAIRGPEAPRKSFYPPDKKGRAWQTKPLFSAYPRIECRCLSGRPLMRGSSFSVRRKRAKRCRGAPPNLRGICRLFYEPSPEAAIYGRAAVPGSGAIMKSSASSRAWRGTKPLFSARTIL